jgi:DNA-binding GntR family transcriptional regulator
MLSTTKPRYVEVADVLASEIETGVFPVGGELPGEHQLCHRFEISRYTTRAALAQLETAGLIARRKGAATTVIAASPPLRYIASTSSEPEILRYAAETTLVLNGGPAPTSASTARRLDLGARDEWVTIEGVRRPSDAGKLPIGHVTVLLRREYADVVSHSGEAHSAIFSRVARQYGFEVTRIDQQFSAKALSTREARLLGAEAGSPALIVVRRYWATPPGADTSSIFEVSVNVHPPDRFYYALTMERSRA